ncbi:hypothetical protein [Sphingomonas sp. 3-13AW]|uniref:hypothetical protein n=1 Tax=Sphingomonas sp. 3-13AW TaxID=3050450 RepID=UPI003BB767A4
MTGKLQAVHLSAESLWSKHGFSDGHPFEFEDRGQEFDDAPPHEDWLLLQESLTIAQRRDLLELLVRRHLLPVIAAATGQTPALARIETHHNPIRVAQVADFGQVSAPASWSDIEVEVSRDQIIVAIQDIKPERGVMETIRDEHTTTDDEFLKALKGEVGNLYARLFQLQVGARFHAFLEWCGVLSEHLQIVSDLHEQGHDPFNMNRHTGRALPVAPYRLAYLAEKMECIFDGAIEVRPARADDDETDLRERIQTAVSNTVVPLTRTMHHATRKALVRDITKAVLAELSGTSREADAGHRAARPLRSQDVDAAKTGSEA